MCKMIAKIGLLLVVATVALSSPSYYSPEDVGNLDQYVPWEEVIEYEPLYLVRSRREVEINPHINKQDGTTNVGGSVTHKGENHEVTGHWNQNVRGPGRSRPNYGVRGSIKW